MEFTCANAEHLCRMFESVSDDIIHRRLGMPSPNPSPASKSASPTLFTFEYINDVEEIKTKVHDYRLPLRCFNDFCYRLFLPPSYYEPKNVWTIEEADRLSTGLPLEFEA